MDLTLILAIRRDDRSVWDGASYKSFIVARDGSLTLPELDISAGDSVCVVVLVSNKARGRRRRERRHCPPIGLNAKTGPLIMYPKQSI
jgi:hypothetical protein